MAFDKLLQQPNQNSQEVVGPLDQAHFESAREIAADPYRKIETDFGREPWKLAAPTELSSQFVELLTELAVVRTQRLDHVGTVNLSQPNWPM